MFNADGSKFLFVNSQKQVNRTSYYSLSAGKMKKYSIYSKEETIRSDMLYWDHWIMVNKKQLHEAILP